MATAPALCPALSRRSAAVAHGQRHFGKPAAGGLPVGCCPHGKGLIAPWLPPTSGGAAPSLPLPQARLAEAQAATARADRLEGESSELVRRIIEMKDREADRMNEMNRLHAETVGHAAPAALGPAAPAVLGLREAGCAVLGGRPLALCACVCECLTV